MLPFSLVSQSVKGISRSETRTTLAVSDNKVSELTAETTSCIDRSYLYLHILLGLSIRRFYHLRPVEIVGLDVVAAAETHSRRVISISLEILPELPIPHQPDHRSLSLVHSPVRLRPA